MISLSKTPKVDFISLGPSDGDIDVSLINEMGANYHNALNNKFAFSTLELASYTTYEEMRNNFNIKVVKSITQVPEAINIVTSLKFRSFAKDKIQKSKYIY
jgi:hypothetical protein